MLHLNRSSGEQSRPLTGTHEILYTIATSGRCLEAIKTGTDNNLYIAPWVDLSDLHHFRVFIRGNKVRAISQYDLLEPPPEEEIPLLRDEIIKLWNRVLISGDVFYEDCCMDVVYRHQRCLGIHPGSYRGCNPLAVHPGLYRHQRYLGIPEVSYQSGVPPENETEDSNVKIVEFNQFGVISRAGSALYNWIQDFHILYYGDADVRLNKRYL